MSDASARRHPDGVDQGPEPDLDGTALGAMSPEQVGAWVSRLRFAPVDADEAARLLATLPAMPADPPATPINVERGRPLPPRRRSAASGADGPDDPTRS